MHLIDSTGSRNSLGSRNAKVPGQRIPKAPPVPSPSVPDSRGREMLHQAQVQRLKPNCMAVGNNLVNIYIYIFIYVWQMFGLCPEIYLSLGKKFFRI